MKFLHLGDLHIGKSLGDFDLISDQRYILEQIVEIATAQEADVVLIAGDVYDKSVPAESAVNLLDYFIQRLTAQQLKVFIITGNHDSDERLNFGASLFAKNDVYIAAKFDGKLHKYELEDNGEQINVFMMPFIKSSQVKHYYPDAQIHSYDDAVRTVIQNSDVNPAQNNILLAHQFVGAKSGGPQLAGSEGMSAQTVGTVEMIGYDCFDAFRYVALGHIHSPQKIGREQVRYSGSPLKYSLSEADNEKSVPVVTVGASGEVDIEFVKLVPKRDLRHIKGKMEQILDKKNITSPEDFIYVTLTDEDIISDAMGILQQVYPNTVRIEYDNSHTKEIGQVDVRQITEHRTFTDMISEFYQLMYGCEISEEELEVINEIAGEAGVANETN
jgi:exonuclease SbcD